MKVYFKNSDGIEREIGDVKSYDEGKELIHSFLDERNYRLYYWREWTTENGTHVDVGSHTEFFRIK